MVTYIHLKVTTKLEHHGLGEAPFRLGDWLVEPRINRLTRGGESIQIELKMMDVLVCLAERSGELVTRREITDTVWATEFITEKTLTRAVAELRRTLGDDAKQPRYIETIHRKGYRLIAPAEAVERPTATVTPFPGQSVEREDDRSPYPGLAAFTEDDAEFFFGRESEVAQLWRKITARRLLALIGPSGVGKSSLLRAGLIPASPEGWGSLVFHPGESAFRELGRGLVPVFKEDTRAIGELLYIDAPDRAVALVSRWRALHQRALLIVDQFEELFTLNPPEVRERFGALIGSLTRDADVHVLVSIRDDFLYRCNDHEALSPIFSELTPIKVPARDDLHRALIEPAARMGYSFEDKKLVDEMMDAVADERGALPMLAFAVARIWEHRDREGKLLTRQSYAEIGGVEGALAHHAEATLERIGRERLPVVRELFRNLVTSEGTRAVREWDELLSVFSDSRRESPEDVLRELINARLLTSYEICENDEAPTRRVEIVHESLLTNWPRLVGWQTQDADSARLRDQLRQAAKTWDEHGRSDDTLWTGAAYREFASWRERYPGGLSELEDAFALAMTSLATRRKRRRRAAVTTIIFALLAGLAIVGVFWRRSVLEARRAEAAKLLALAEVQIDDGPTEALAYSTASLELADTQEARLFAVKALSAGPPLRTLDLRQYTEDRFPAPAFSPDGRFLAVAGISNPYVLVFDENGGDPIVLGGHATSSGGSIPCGWTRDNLLVTGRSSEGRVRVWSIPDGRLVRTIEFDDRAWWQVGDEYLLAEVGQSTDPGEPWPLMLLRWRLPDGEAENLGTVDFRSVGASSSRFDSGGDAWIYTKGRGVYSRPLPITPGLPDRLIAQHTSDDVRLGGWPRPQGVYAAGNNGEIIFWTTPDGLTGPVKRSHLPRKHRREEYVPDPGGRWLIDQHFNAENFVLLWDLSGLPYANPYSLKRVGAWGFSVPDFHPRGSWVAAQTGESSEITFWPISRLPPFVVDTADFTDVAFVPWFTPDGGHLLTWAPQSGKDWLRLWSLPGSQDRTAVEFSFTPPRRRMVGCNRLGPRGQRVLCPGYGYEPPAVLSLTGEEPFLLEGFPPNEQVHGAFSPSGRLVAAVIALKSAGDEATVRIWDLETSEVSSYELPEDRGLQRYITFGVEFVDETTLYVAGEMGLIRWNFETGSYAKILDDRRVMVMAANRQKMITYKLTPGYERSGPFLYHDLQTGDVQELEIPYDPVNLSPDGTIWVAAEESGLVWVGRVDGGEPHVLAGHSGPTWVPSISPDNRWVVSFGVDKTLRLWPMPDLDTPPLHTLPHDVLIAKLKSLTNLRAVRDPESSSGWKIEIGPFPGWETVPTW